MIDKKEKTGYLIQNIGMLLFLAIVFMSTLIFSNAGKETFWENNIMIFIMFLGIICVNFSKATLGIIISAAQTLIYTVYKLFYSYAYGVDIKTSSYVWIVFPILSIYAMILFNRGIEKIESENKDNKKQIEELSTIDPITGLYNLNSFYRDILAQIQYTKRNKIPITLMIIKLCGEEKFKKELNKKKYELLIQRFARIIENGTRLEDRIYNLNGNGELGIILTCDAEGAAIVENRFRYNLDKKEVFEGIVDSNMEVTTQIAFIQYNDNINDDIIGFKELVESKLQDDK